MSARAASDLGDLFVRREDCTRPEDGPYVFLGVRGDRGRVSWRLKAHLSDGSGRLMNHDDSGWMSLADAIKMARYAATRMKLKAVPYGLGAC